MYKNKVKYVWIILVLSIGLFGCSSDIKRGLPQKCLSINSPCLSGKAEVEMNTNKGTIILEVNGLKTPVTSGNFLDLINKKVYNGTIFHRVIRSPFPFVVQGGDPISKEPGVLREKLGTGSYIDELTGQARFIPLEIKLANETEPRYGQLIEGAGEIEDVELKHQKGSLAMARSQEPDSASAQFYIALKSLPELDGRYSVFGRVVKGMDIVESISQGDQIFSIRILRYK